MSKKNNTPSREEHSNKVFQTLSFLDQGERKRLHKYLNSPYFNQSKTLTKLGEIFLDHIEKGKTGFNKTTVWHKIFPAENYDDVNFRKYCSDLLKLVEGFMGQEFIAQNDTRQALDTLNFVVLRKIEPLFSSVLRQTRSEIDDTSYRSIDFYRNSYFIERLYYSMMDFDVKPNMRANIEAISANLDVFYWIEKLKLYSSVLSQQRMGNFEYNIEFTDEIINHLKGFNLENVPELAIYYYSFMTLKEEDNVQHYYNLRRLLDVYGTSMPQEEAIELIDSALHYCTGKINKGDSNFYQEYFNLFEDSIEKGVLISKGELASWRFNNVIAAALRLGKLDWAEGFIEKFKNYLPADTRENTYTFNLARVYRFQGKYEQVLGLLRNIEYEDIGYNLISKAMQLISYYELGEYDALDSHKTAFQTYLKRHKDISKARGMSYLNLIKFTRKLVKLKPNDKAAKEKLKAEITINKPNTVNYEWLMEKLT